jgi:hypothetical protein
MEIVFVTPSSYQTDAKLSIGRARFFLRCGQESPASVGITRSVLMTDPGPSGCRVHGGSLRVTSCDASGDDRSFALSRRPAPGLGARGPRKRLLERRSPRGRTEGPTAHSFSSHAWNHYLKKGFLVAVTNQLPLLLSK